MSESAGERPPIDYGHLANHIDDNFKFVAEHLPTKIKTADAGTTETLCHIDGVGYLTATYVGKTRDGSDPINNFVVRVSMLADGFDGQLGFYKDYALTYQSRRSEGPVIDKQPTVPEDFTDCPGPVEVLAFAVGALTEEFRLRYTGPEAEIIYLDDYRQDQVI